MKKKLCSEKNKRKIFSISKEFKEVYDILEETPIASRFICEAIIEKYNRDKNPVNIEGQVLQVIQNILNANKQVQSLFGTPIANYPQMNNYVQEQSFVSSVTSQNKADDNDINTIPVKPSEDISLNETVITKENKELNNEELDSLRDEVRDKFNSW
ncbi:MAG: hypothetical protein K0R54_133 [Clostridiaceae bacterium]|nr:hypothetical protein [Clostridiaceae bacterium]